MYGAAAYGSPGIVLNRPWSLDAALTPEQLSQKQRSRGCQRPMAVFRDEAFHSYEGVPCLQGNFCSAARSCELCRKCPGQLVAACNVDDDPCLHGVPEVGGSESRCIAWPSLDLGWALEPRRLWHYRRSRLLRSLQIEWPNTQLRNACRVHSRKTA